MKSSEIYNGSVSAEKLATNAVTTEKIVNGAVTSEKLSFVPGGVRPLVLPVATDEIADDAVTTSKIGELQVSSSKLQVESVTTEKIASGAVNGERLAVGAVTRPKLLYKSVEVIVPAGQYNGDSAPDIDLVGGEVLGWYPLNDRTTRSIQMVVLGGDGSIRITVLTPAVNDGRFRVVVLRP